MATPTNLEQAQAIWGTSPTDFYVGDGNGAVAHFDGTAFAPAFHDPNNLGVTSLYESPGGQVAVAASQLFLCAGQCTSAANYAALPNYASLACQVVAVCGSGETIYAVGSTGANTTSGPSGCLLTSDGSGNWSSIVVSQVIAGATACAAEPDGIAFIVGQGSIASYSPSVGVTAEAINWPPNTGSNSVYVTFQAAWTDGVNSFAAGGDRRIFARTSGGWNPVLNNGAIDPNRDNGSSASFNAIAGAGGQAWAFGDALGTHQVAYFDGSVWSYVPDIDSQDAFFAAWAADPAHYYAVGSLQSMLGPLVVEGHP
jgi:hypothetical protein